jgi:hypothetical protein
VLDANGRLYVTHDLVFKPYLAQITHQTLAPYEDEVICGNKFPGNAPWGLKWAFPEVHGRDSVIETGFPFAGVHIDRHGIYDQCSLTRPEAREEVMAYHAPRPAMEILLHSNIPSSKYRQRPDPVRWEGVVLPLQIIYDRAIKHTPVKDQDPIGAYLGFVDRACEKYGKHLFLKLHPQASEGENKRWESIARSNGCGCGLTDLSVLERCEFVLAYNSTFAFDCWLRGVPVAQYAPGYFYQTGGVTYTEGKLPDAVDMTTVEVGRKLADFVVWRYCFNRAMPIDRWVQVWRHFAQTDDLFPLPEELSYAANLQYRDKTWKLPY